MHEYVISLREVFWGIALIGFTLIVHAFGMVLTLRASHALGKRIGPSAGFMRGTRILVVASWLIVLTHICEVMMWAGFFLWRGALPTWSTANYYVLLQYTTVGSEITLTHDWRLLGGMLPMAGMLTFAWSTAELLSLAMAFEESQLVRRGIHKAAEMVRGSKEG